MLKRDKNTGKIVINLGEVRMATDVPGISFDFNCGIHLTLPAENYEIRFKNLDYCTEHAVTVTGPAEVRLGPAYYYRYGLEVLSSGKPVWTHEYNAAGRNVHIEMANLFSLKEVLTAISAAEQFRVKHGCRLYVTVLEKYADILRPAYPEIEIFPITLDKENDFLPGAWHSLPQEIYATYYMGMFTDDYYTPEPVKMCGLKNMFAKILGVDSTDWITNKLVASTGLAGKVPSSPYACVGLYAGKDWEQWHSSRGWEYVLRYLRSIGYRILCLDTPDERVKIAPELLEQGAEDFTGKTLQENIDLLSGADFCIGTANDISWLAWGTRRSVVLISGAPRRNMQFYTPYMGNYHGACDYCRYSDHIYEGKEGCPEYSGTDKEFECTKLVTPQNICRLIRRVIRDNDLMPDKDFEE